MKIIVLVFCALFAVASADWEPKTYAEITVIRNECLISEKVSEANIAKIKNNQFPDEEDVRCYVRCLVEKSDTWDDENGYNLERCERQLKKLNSKASLENLAICLSPKIKNADSCAGAYEGFKCCLDNKYLVLKVFKQVDFVKEYYDLVNIA